MTDMIEVPKNEWEEMKRKVDDIQRKVDDIYTRDTEYISMSELCEWLQISRTKLWRLRSQDKIKTYVVGGKLVANKTEIQSQLNLGQL